MARAGIVFGLILCGITVAGLVATSEKTPTQFYPMMLGIPILFCGVVALNPHRRRSAMLSAVLIAATGAALGAAWSMYQWIALFDGGSEIDRYSLRLIAVMSLVCLMFSGFCLVGFAKMRRRSLSQFHGNVTTLRMPASADPISDDTDRPSSREIA